MSVPEDGGAAFPEAIAVGPAGDLYAGPAGMSLRDWFAGQALGSIPVRNWDADNVPGEQIFRQWAQAAYATADAMLKERDK